MLQISHMSLVPALTCSRLRRDRLNSYRNSFTFISSVIVLTCALVLFQTVKDAITAFQVLGYIAIVIGTITSIGFIVNIDELRLTKNCVKFSKHLGTMLRSRLERSKDQSQLENNYSIVSISQAAHNNDITEYEETPKGGLRVSKVEIEFVVICVFIINLIKF